MAASVRKKSTGWYPVDADTVAVVKLLKANYSAITSAIGLTFGAPPEGKLIFDDNLTQLCIDGIVVCTRVVVQTTADTTQVHSVYVARTKIDDFIKTGATLKFAGKPIVKIGTYTK